MTRTVHATLSPVDESVHAAPDAADASAPPEGSAPSVPGGFGTEEPLSLGCWLLALLPLLALPVPVAHADGPVDLDFEQGQPGRPAPGWFVPERVSRWGFHATLSDSAPHGGRQCLELTGPAMPAPSTFGNALQRFPAAAWRGKRVEFSAWVRVAPGSGSTRVQLWMRGDRADQSMAFLDNMSDRPITSADWSEQRIVARVAEDVETLNLGVILIGSGSAWVDDVSFRAVADAGGDEGPGPLSERGLANLVAFTRLLGYVRYFHPSDEAARADWDALSVAAVDTVERAADAKALAATLRALFLPLAPTLELGTRPVDLAPECFALPGAHPTAATSWLHHGFGGTLPPQGIYSSRRVERPVPGEAGFRPMADAVLHENLGGGVWCALALALPRDSTGTLPHATRPPWSGGPVRPPSWGPDPADRATRLADVALFWNVPQHFYPYFDAIDVDWPAALREALRSAATDRGRGPFHATLLRLVAHLRDGHGYVDAGTDYSARLPLAWDWVEGGLVVTNVPDSLAGRVRPGDEVAAIDGASVAARYAALEPLLCGATEGYRRWRALAEIGRGAGRDSVTLELADRAGTRRVVRLSRGSELPPAARRPERWSELRPGILYVDLERAGDATVDSLADRLAAARGVIFDMRGYPAGMRSVLGLLADSVLTSPQWHVPVITRPDHREGVYDFASWTIAPRAPHIRGRVAFLIDARAISAAETLLGIVEHYHLGELVGTPTAGTNGNVATVVLPGHCTLGFTGMQVLKQDGSRHHGVGIRPSVPVPLTRAGLAEGRDEQLDRALEIVSR